MKAPLSPLAPLSRAISGDTGDDKTLSGGAYAQFDARYASGTLNVNSAADGHVNTNSPPAAASAGRAKTSPPAFDELTATPGVIFNTGLEDDGRGLAPGLTGGSFPAQRQA